MSHETGSVWLGAPAASPALPARFKVGKGEPYPSWVWPLPILQPLGGQARPCAVPVDQLDPDGAFGAET